MIREGRDLATIDPHMVVKVPFSKDGVKACKALRAEGIRVNVTLVFSADAGAAGRQGRRDLRQPVRRPARRHRAPTAWSSSSEIVDIYDNYEFATEVLVASARHPMHIVARRPAWAPTSARARRR